MSDVADAKAPIEVRFRGGGFAPRPHRWMGPAVFIVIIAFVEWGTRAGWISSLTLPKPSDVLEAFRELWDSGLLFQHLAPSLSRLAVGATLGATVGIGVGSSPTCARALCRWSPPSSQFPKSRFCRCS